MGLGRWTAGGGFPHMSRVVSTGGTRGQNPCYRSAGMTIGMLRLRREDFPSSLLRSA
jgi:hypothetical protein